MSLDLLSAAVVNHVPIKQQMTKLGDILHPKKMSLNLLSAAVVIVPIMTAALDKNVDIFQFKGINKE